MATRRPSRRPARVGERASRATHQLLDRIRSSLHSLTQPKEQPLVIAERYGIFMAVTVAGLGLLVVLWPRVVPVTTDSSAVPRIRHYTSSAYGYRVSYPPDWSYDVAKVSTLPSDILEQVTFHSGGGTVMVRTARRVSTTTLIPAAPVPLTLNGVAALWYHDYDPGTGLPLDRIIVRRSDGLFNELRGYGAAFEEFAKGFSLVSKLQPPKDLP